MSCSHLTKSLILTSIQRIQEKRLDSSFGTKNHVCVYCGFKGKLNDNSFRSHFKDSNFNHFLSTSCEKPYELYCFLCNDYQFCNVFDNFLTRERKHNVTNEMPLNSNNTLQLKTRGLCNMGSTCFLNSVLQVFLNNIIFFKFSTSENDCALEKIKKNKSLLNQTSKPNIFVCIACEFRKLCFESRL
jgi:hypothetical protein